MFDRYRWHGGFDPDGDAMPALGPCTLPGFIAPKPGHTPSSTTFVQPRRPAQLLGDDRGAAAVRWTRIECECGWVGGRRQAGGGPDGVPDDMPARRVHASHVWQTGDGT